MLTKPCCRPAIAGTRARLCPQEENEGIKFGEISKVASVEWKALDADAKAPFEARNKELKSAYEINMAEFKSLNPDYGKKAPKAKKAKAAPVVGRRRSLAAAYRCCPVPRHVPTHTVSARACVCVCTHVRVHSIYVGSRAVVVVRVAMCCGFLRLPIPFRFTHIALARFLCTVYPQPQQQIYQDFGGEVGSAYGAYSDEESD